MDGNSVCHTDYCHFRICLQLSTKQYHLCSCRTCVWHQPCAYGHHPDRTDSIDYFGGIQRIAKVSSIIVPVMALGYVGLALVIVLINITHLPDVIGTIVSHAFGWQQALGGGVAAALMQGIKRGLFSNEAGMGSAPNVAATAFVSHPVKQGLIQTLGVSQILLLSVHAQHSSFFSVVLCSMVRPTEYNSLNMR